MCINIILIKYLDSHVLDRKDTTDLCGKEKKQDHCYICNIFLRNMRDLQTHLIYSHHYVQCKTCSKVHRIEDCKKNSRNAKKPVRTELDVSPYFETSSSISSLPAVKTAKLNLSTLESTSRSKETCSHGIGRVALFWNFFKCLFSTGC